MKAVSSNLIIENLGATAIDFNGVMCNARRFDSVLAKYVRPLIIKSEHEIYKVYVRGSATPIKYRNRFFLLCTQHQIADIPLEDVSILKNDGSVLITTGGVRHFETRGDTDLRDLVAFDFTEPCADHPDLVSDFFHFREPPPDAPSADTVFVQVTGFPSARQLYELDRNRLGLQKYKVLCKLHSQPRDEALIALKPINTLKVDPDGMSGGCAFSVQFVSGKAFAFFAGIVVRGGLDRLYILKSGFIKDFLDATMAISDRASRVQTNDA